MAPVYRNAENLRNPGSNVHRRLAITDPSNMQEAQAEAQTRRYDRK